MFCNDCAIANELYVCSDAIVVGTASANTDYYIFVHNNTTDSEFQFQSTSDNTGLITWELDTVAMFGVGMSYTMWVTTTADINTKITVTSNLIEWDCIDIKFKNLFDVESCCVCLESQSIMVRTTQSGSDTGQCCHEPILITEDDFTDGVYQNNLLIGLSPMTQFNLYTNDGSGTLLQPDTGGEFLAYVFDSVLGTLTIESGNYLLIFHA